MLLTRKRGCDRLRCLAGRLGKPYDRGHFVGGNNQVFLGGLDPEFPLPGKPRFSRLGGDARVKDRNIVKDDPARAGLMVPTEIPRPTGPRHDNRDSMKVFMPRVEHVAGHRQAAQWRSKAEPSSEAIASGPRPSIWWRCRK